MKKIFTLAVILILTIRGFVSCKKETVTANDGSLHGTPDAQLRVALNGTYLPPAKIDSAVAIWEVAGTAQTVPLRPGGNLLTTALTNFVNSGSGTLTVQLFTQSMVSDKPLQWEQRFAYTLNRKAAVQLAAPVGLNDASWNPRAISHSQMANANATLIIALRPEDAYFELKDVAPDVAKRIEIVRSFYLNDTTALIASRGWIGQADNLNSNGGLVNRDHFAALPVQIAGRAWSKYKIRASFYAALNPDRIYETEFVNDKP